LSLVEAGSASTSPTSRTGFAIRVHHSTDHSLSECMEATDTIKNAFHVLTIAQV